LCGNLCALHHVKNSFICSNYYRHVQACVEKQKAEETKPNQKKFIQPALNFSISNVNQKSSISSVVHDEVSDQHVVDLTSNADSNRSFDKAASKHTSTDCGDSKPSNKPVF